MSETIGHDMNGRPLASGDKVFLVWALPHLKRYEGKVFEVVGEADPPLGEPSVEIQGNGLYGAAYQRHLRKLHDDHLPANESFGEMVNKLGQGNASEGIRRLLSYNHPTP